jgi:hypothetical protein
MHNKLRTTLTSLSVALGFVASTLMLAQPLAPSAMRSASISAVESESAPQAAADDTLDRERRSARVNLTMPYYSFARLLPRRES